MENKKNVVLALRTHFWDEYIEYISQKLNGSTNICEFVIICDETKSKFSCGSYNKISHTEDISTLGIEYIPQFNLWYNGDYPLYVLMDTYKDADYFIMVENDVLINKNIDGLIEYVYENKIDVIFHDFQDTIEWAWEPTLTESFDITKKCLFPFLLLSKNVLKYLFNRKKEIINKYINNEIKHLPYCEGFIASCVNEIKDSIKISTLEKFFDIHHFTFENPYYILDPQANKLGSICHPVRGHDFAQKRDIKEIFKENSPLRKGLSLIDPNLFYKDLLKRVKNTGNLDSMIRFSDIAVHNRWTPKPEPINWALGAKAWTSSVSAWSMHSSVEAEGAAACDGNFNRDYAFHTSNELCPSITIELNRNIECRHIYIYNRLIFKERASKIKIETSDNNTDWDVVASYSEGIDFGGSDGLPLIITLDFKILKYIKISLLEKGTLHLVQIEVYSQ
ncbi:discoidin domain-containing protein [Acetobacter malorum]|uniref:discoidin domain-containing protein n=1 Tax=Acetobacter malorum TaxID=178901 RepID=UPI0039EB4FD3